MNEVTTVSPQALMEKAMQSDDIAVLERIIDLNERIVSRNAQSEFVAALSRFQRDCPEVKALKQGHNCKYAPLQDIIAQVKALLVECGLSYRFEQSQTEKEITVTCLVTHLSGHSETTTVSAMPDTAGSKNSVQAIGSTITYLRRYSFTGALGIVTADVDSDARLAGQATQEFTDAQMVMDIEALIEDTGSERVKVLQWVSTSVGAEITAFNQLYKKDGQKVIKRLKDKEAKNV